MGDALHVLVVDDNPDHRFFTRRALGRLEGGDRFLVDETADGDEALRHLRRTDAPPPDLVLLDLKMPRQDGFAVLHAMQEDPSLSQIPVIVVTSSQHDEDARRAFELGARAYVTKPVAADALARALAKALPDDAAKRSENQGSRSCEIG